MTCPIYRKAVDKAAEAHGLVYSESVRQILGLTLGGFNKLRREEVIPPSLGRLGPKLVWDRRLMERGAALNDAIGGDASGVRFAIAAVRAIDAGHLRHEGAGGEAVVQARREKRAHALIARIANTPYSERAAALLAEANGVKVGADGRAIETEAEKEAA